MDKLTVEQIVSIEGIVIRKIPKDTVSAYRDRETGDFYQESKPNSLGGLYLVTYKGDQYSMVSFDKRATGMGLTVQAALHDLVHNHTVSVRLVEALESMGCTMDPPPNV